MTHHLDLTTIRLLSGSHPGEPAKGCVMEWVSVFAGERTPEDKTDHPACTSPVLTAFAIAWNDGVSDDDRQALIPYIPKLVGTSGDPKADEVRAWMATDWLVRTFAPVWLRKAGLVDRAAELEALPELSSARLAKAAQKVIDQAKAAAWDAARAAAWDAAGAAARAAARAAAWDAAGDAARAAAGAAAGKTKGGYSAKYAAARKAADEILRPALADTAAELRASGLALFDRMIAVGKEPREGDPLTVESPILEAASWERWDRDAALVFKGMAFERSIAAAMGHPHRWRMFLAGVVIGLAVGVCGAVVFR